MQVPSKILFIFKTTTDPWFSRPDLLVTRLATGVVDVGGRFTCSYWFMFGIALSRSWSVAVLSSTIFNLFY